MMFANRSEAGKKLAEKLNQHPLVVNNQSNLVVVGLPRGGVLVALEVARKFACPLDIIASKKIPYPGQPEYAIGAVTSDGIMVLNPDIPDNQQWHSYIEKTRQELLEYTIEIERRFYQLALCKPSSFKDKTVIVVDDGIATGMTAMAALETARHRGAEKTIMAAPVVSIQSLEDMRLRCDHVVAVYVPDELHSVGQYYLNFDQTGNEEVVQALSEGTRFASVQALHKE